MFHWNRFGIFISLQILSIHIDALLSADASSFLNPEYVIKALKTECGILSNPDLTKEYYSIMRTAAYKADMTEFR